MILKTRFSTGWFLPSSFDVNIKWMRWRSGSTEVRNGFYGQFWFNKKIGVWNEYTIETVLTLLQGSKCLVSSIEY